MSDFDISEVLRQIEHVKRGDEYKAQQAAHANCGNGGKTVTCDRCKRTYICSPWDDFYCAAEGDHCCESCLLRGRQVAEIDPDAPIAEPVFREPRAGGR